MKRAPQIDFQFHAANRAVRVASIGELSLLLGLRQDGEFVNNCDVVFLCVVCCSYYDYCLPRQQKILVTTIVKTREKNHVPKDQELFLKNGMVAGIIIGTASSKHFKSVCRRCADTINQQLTMYCHECWKYRGLCDCSKKAPMPATTGLLRTVLLCHTPELPGADGRTCCIELIDTGEWHIAKYNKTIECWKLTHGAAVDKVYPSQIGQWFYLDEVVYSLPHTCPRLVNDSG